MSLRPQDPEKAWKRQREWRERSVRRYEERLQEEGVPKYRTIERNDERAQREWERAYHSEDRVLFVHSLGCCVCGEKAENAHLPGSGGMGMKGPYTDIVPLCPRHHRAGFEDSLHELGSVERFNERWDVDLVAVAEDTERRWRERER